MDLQKSLGKQWKNSYEYSYNINNYPVGFHISCIYSYFRTNIDRFYPRQGFNLGLR